MQHATISAKQATPPADAAAWSPLRNNDSGRVHQRKCSCGGTPGPSGECEACRKRRLQRKAIGPDRGSQLLALNSRPLSDVSPIVHEVLRSPGQPLDAATRAFMEPRFGHDFSHVRIHKDAKAVESARAVNALAYTVGSNIVFGRKHYAPGGGTERALIAHELAHVVQQTHAPTSSPVSNEPRIEAEAHQAASEISHRTGSVGVLNASKFRISRQESTLSPALNFLTPQDLAKLKAFGQTDYLASLDTLEKMLRVTGGLTQQGLPRSYVSTRQASGELRTFLDVIRNPDVKAVKVVPTATGGRSPDLYYTEVSGAESRVEVVNITAAAAGMRAELQYTPKGEIRRLVPKLGGNVVNTVAGINSIGKLREAIRVKIKTGSQLSAQNKNTQVAGRPMVGGGEVRVSTSHIELSKEEIDGVVNDLQSELANSSATKIIIDTVDKADPHVGRKLFEYVLNDQGRFVFSQTRVSYARETRSSAAKKSATITGAEEAAVGAPAGLPEYVGGAVTESMAEAKLPRAGPNLVPAEVEIGAPEVVVAGLSASVVPIVIGVGIGQVAQWLQNLSDQAAMKAGMRSLAPKIEARLERLAPKIAQLQRRGKVYCRVTIDFAYEVQNVVPAGIAGNESLVYLGTSLVTVDVAGEMQPIERSKRPEQLHGPYGFPEKFIHYDLSYSTLIDDPQKRARAKQRLELAERFRHLTAKKQQAQPSPRHPASPHFLPATGAQPPFPAAPFPSPGSDPSYNLGPSPVVVEAAYAEAKAYAVNLISLGHQYASGSPSPKEIKAFLHDEEAWRIAVTLTLTNLMDNGSADDAHRFDALLNSDQYGGQLKKLRNTFGG